MTVTLETEFSENGQSEPWKNDVARQLNALLGHAHKTSSAFCPKEVKESLVSIVQRVANFEEIFVLKGEE